MSIYRGDGGAGNADDDATVNAVAANAVAAASSAAEAAVSASNAAISASAANTKANEAAVSAASASTASASASAAASSEANAAASASSASTSANNAATSAATAASIVGSGNGIFTVPVSYTSTLTGGTGIVNLGSGQFYKDASGNIGIGTTSPSKRIHVSTSDQSTARIRIQNTAGRSFDLVSGVDGLLQTGFSIFDATAAATRLTIDTSGNINLSEQLRTLVTTSAVNYAQITGAVTGSAPTLSAQGSDSNIDITLTPKGTGRVNISTSIKPKVSSTTSVASPLAWNSTSFDEYALTALANALTISADANTSPADGQRMLFRFKDNGTARVLTWTTGATRAFRAIGVVLPTTTVVSKLVYVGCVYNAADSRWDVLAVGQEA